MSRYTIQEISLDDLINRASKLEEKLVNAQLNGHPLVTYEDYRNTYIKYIANNKG